MDELIRVLRDIEDAIKELTRSIEAVQTNDAMGPALRIKGAVYTDGGIFPANVERR